MFSSPPLNIGVSFDTKLLVTSHQYSNRTLSTDSPIKSAIASNPHQPKVHLLDKHS